MCSVFFFALFVCIVCVVYIMSPCHLNFFFEIIFVFQTAFILSYRPLCLYNQLVSNLLFYVNSCVFFVLFVSFPISWFLFSFFSCSSCCLYHFIVSFVLLAYFFLILCWFYHLFMSICCLHNFLWLPKFLHHSFRIFCVVRIIYFVSFVLFVNFL